MLVEGMAMNKYYEDPLDNKEDVIYRDEDGTWMVQPTYKEGWLIEPHAMYPQPTPLNGDEKED